MNQLLVSERSLLGSYIENADFWISRPKRKHIWLISCFSTQNRFGNVAYHSDNVSWFPIKNSHFIFARSTSVKQILSLVERHSIEIRRNTTRGLQNFFRCLGFCSRAWCSSLLSSDNSSRHSSKCRVWSFGFSFFDISKSTFDVGTLVVIEKNFLWAWSFPWNYSSSSKHA